MPIKFPCPKCNSNLKIADTYKGQPLRCPAPNCGANITPDIVTLNKELSEIEAVINELEEKIKDGRHSVAIVKQRILEIADPSELMAKVNAGDQRWIEAYKKEVQRVGELDTIGLIVKRLHALRNQHPNDSRIIQLGYRAADCYMKLGEIHLTAGEAPGQQEMLEDSKKMMSTMFPQWVPKPSVPANQGHLKAQEARERVERQQREEQERRAKEQREKEERLARQKREKQERQARQEREEREHLARLSTTDLDVKGLREFLMRINHLSLDEQLRMLDYQISRHERQAAGDENTCSTVMTEHIVKTQLIGAISHYGKVRAKELMASVAKKGIETSKDEVDWVAVLQEKFPSSSRISSLAKSRASNLKHLMSILKMIEDY